MRIKVGAGYYETRQAANNAYGTVGANTAILEGRIVIGAPPIKDNQRLMIDSKGRYIIMELH